MTKINNCALNNSNTKKGFKFIKIVGGQGI